MVRELASLCLAPVVLAGYLASTDFHFKSTKHQTTVENAAMVEVMTCDKGWGLDAKMATNGLYGAGVQYGFKFEPAQDFSVSFIPKLGVSYTDRPRVELPQQTQFGLGGQVLFGYKDARLGVELWHLSNGKSLGMNYDSAPNIGLNLVAIQFGWVF